jgi:hypothetical protein
MMRPQPPEARDGYQWVPVQDHDWAVVSPDSGRRCRRKDCCRAPVARLMRRDKHALAGVTPWHYCAEHMYGRWVEDGKVMHWRLVLDRDRGTQP